MQARQHFRESIYCLSMRIVALEPALVELIQFFGLADQLVGVSHRCAVIAKGEGVPPVAVTAPRKEALGKVPPAQAVLSPDLVNLELLVTLDPTHVVTALPFPDSPTGSMKAWETRLSERLGHPVKVIHSHARTFNQLLEMYEELASALGVRQKGIDYIHRVRAQVMNWCDNFYDRMKNKKVTFLSGVDPFMLGGRWIPDLIHLASGISQVAVPGEDDKKVSWAEIVAFRPDVIIVSPRGLGLKESMACFKVMEKLPQWEEVPAVKRGEVIFTDGIQHFHEAGPNLIESMAVLISALAGFESGYLGAKDSFFRLRWLEMQRHRY